MEVRNGKKMNFKRIYSQVAKYGKTLSELAKEYGMEEQAFIERLKMGLEPKLFATLVKTSERKEKAPKYHNESASTPEVENTQKTDNKQEEEEMTRRTEERLNQNYRQAQATRSKNVQAQTLKKSVSTVEDIETFEKKKLSITGEISKNESELNKATQILSIREETLAKTQSVFDKARKALESAKDERDKAVDVVAQHKRHLENLKDSLKKVDAQITEMKNNIIYLVAPGYTGNKPEYGRYYSTVKVNGYPTLSVVDPDVDYAIEPELKDMVIAGYDSYKEYMEGLRFVMLCVEYTCKDTRYTVLVNDDRLERLLQAHVG